MHNKPRSYSLWLAKCRVLNLNWNKSLILPHRKYSKSEKTPVAAALLDTTVLLYAGALLGVIHLRVGGEEFPLIPSPHDAFMPSTGGKNSPSPPLPTWSLYTQHGSSIRWQPLYYHIEFACVTWVPLCFCWNWKVYSSRVVASGIKCAGILHYCSLRLLQ